MSLLIEKKSDVILETVRRSISQRYKTVTKAINKEFWGSGSDTTHSLIVGSYGRNTAISTSDIDILVEIPNSEFERLQDTRGNAQSRFLQIVKNAITQPYRFSDIRADGQVIKINFSDGIQFEIVPAFKNRDSTYIYPNSNMGGNWLSTNPQKVKEAMMDKNQKSNGLFNATCRHFRWVRQTYFSSYILSGIAIDSFVYNAIEGWYYTSQGEEGAPQGSYENTLLNYFNNNYNYKYLKAPGSGEKINIKSSIAGLEKVLKKIAL